MTQTTRRPRRRRSRGEILSLIRTAALQLFAERGYAGTTTLEIARRAGVSESLLFRHFGDKARLYDAVVSEPFLQIMDAFREDRRQASLGDTSSPHQQSARLFDFFAANREVFSALVLGSAAIEGQEPVRLTGLEDTFRLAAGEVAAAYQGMGHDPPFDVDIAVRLAFGMVAASVLLRPLLFSASDATSEQIRETVTALNARSLWPVDAAKP